ncbi:hypothetical protein DDB_G0272044 [Dictyostelium discoideum AX4]|uniref:Uncharacterized protein n=1 Tax=Dictyostelium discoideum TaxID=44689 RepID=Q55A76_DICDI|nr:hypothetical protein DDB_G0272044 [Dictyostelium discoideum AX4]EAL71456.1 hypothetical protein DDB_G0272044 [Dictyostelium discoideum AX4]|eukprot:XP_645390.1 hypothetical protein DDB_G0272044 [Dictyostelium discoideum AX4]
MINRGLFSTKPTYNPFSITNTNASKFSFGNFRLSEQLQILHHVIK